MDENLLRHDLNHMHSDDKWGHLAMPLDDLLDAKDAEISRLKSELQQQAMDYLALDMQAADALDEIARLRTALTDLLRHTTAPYGSPARDAEQRARAVLAHPR